MKKIAVIALLLSASLCAEGDNSLKEQVKEAATPERPVQPYDEYVMQKAEEAKDAALRFFARHPQYSKFHVVKNHPYWAGYGVAGVLSLFFRKPIRVPSRVLAIFGVAGAGFGFAIDGIKNALPDEVVSSK